MNPAPGREYEGLLGNNNGDPNDDFVSVAGVLEQPLEWADLHSLFADKWRVTNDTSLFEYDEGESADTFFIPGFPETPTNIENVPEELRLEAERACADVENQIAFQDCVFDVGCSGEDSFVEDHLIRDPEFNADIQTLAQSIELTNLEWGHSIEGTTLRDFAIADASITLTMTLLDAPRLNAFDSRSGKRLWQLDGVERCKPAIVNSEHVVVQLSAEESGALLLLDAQTGREIDRLVSEDNALVQCSGEISQGSSGRIILSNRNQSHGFRLTNNTLRLDWSSDYESDPLLAGFSPRGLRVLLNDNFYLSGIKAGAIHIFSLDANTGFARHEFATNLSLDAGLQKAGDDLLALTGAIGPDSQAIGITTSSSGTMTQAWSRSFSVDASDGITRSLANVAPGPNGFASWTTKLIDGRSRAGVAEFDAQTGLALWFSQTSSFDNNDQVVALSDGSYAVSPFGSSNFIESHQSDGSADFSLPYPAGTNFPVTLLNAGDDRIVVISTLEERSVVVALKTNER